MNQPRFRLSLGMLLILLVALDIAGFQYALAPRGTGKPLNVYVLNTIPMANVLLLMAYRFGVLRVRPGPFATGFLVVGWGALAVQFLLDTAAPGLTWGFYDSALEVAMRAIREGTDLLKRYGVADLGGIQMVRKGYFIYFPAMVVIFAAPQFVLALAGGLLGSATKRWAGIMQRATSRE